MGKQKWINEDGILYAIHGDTTICESPGKGIFQLYESQSMGGRRLGLKWLDNKFNFDFKVYDLGCENVIEKVKITWESEVFIRDKKNLGVIFNGLKGTGKTIAAKLLSNRLDIPVIIIPDAYDGILEFIQTLSFECVVLIDEAEKTFKDNSEQLLKMIDGVYNMERKLYILTTNRLSLDENLLGRPGRIRYIREFGNMTAKAVNDYIDDNLIDMSKKDVVLNQVDMLEISTIDILKAIVDEVNIHGCLSENNMLNIPKTPFKVDVIKFEGLNESRFNELKEYIFTNKPEGEAFGSWFFKICGKDEEGDDIDNGDKIRSMFNCRCYKYNLASRSPMIFQGQYTRIGLVIEAPDSSGFFVVEDDYNDEKSLCCVLRQHDTPSLYRGRLIC